MATLSPGLVKLLREPAYAQIATTMPDGSPQIAQVWIDTDGENILVNTREHSVKVRNVNRDPRVAVNVHDPANQWRIATIRGRVAEVTLEGGDPHIDQLAKKYRGLDEYPWKDPNNRRVIIKIVPERVREQGLEEAA